MTELYRVDSLHNNGGGGTATVADGSNTILTNLQLVQQRHNDARARAAQRMTQRNGSTVRVHIGALKSENLCKILVSNAIASHR